MPFDATRSPISRAAAGLTLVGLLVLAGRVLGLEGWLFPDAASLPGSREGRLSADSELAFTAVGLVLAAGLLGVATGLFRLDRERRGAAVSPTRALIEMRVAAGFGAALLLLVVVGGVTYRVGRDATQWALGMAQTQEVRTRLGQFYATVSDAESAARAYRLSSLPRYREAFAGFAAESRQHARALSAL